MPFKNADRYSIDDYHNQIQSLMEKQILPIVPDPACLEFVDSNFDVVRENGNGKHYDRPMLKSAVDYLVHNLSFAKHETRYRTGIAGIGSTQS
jgi:hypothetical protein